jgi:hypothetical protein
MGITRRQALAAVGGISGIGGIVLYANRGSGCGPADTPIAELHPDSSGPVCGRVTDINYSDDLFTVDDGTGTALIAPRDSHAPSNRPDLETGNCICVNGAQGSVTGDHVDVYFSVAVWTQNS